MEYFKAIFFLEDENDNKSQSFSGLNISLGVGGQEGMVGYPKKKASRGDWLYLGVFAPKWKRGDLACLNMTFSLERIFIASAWGMCGEDGFCLNRKFFELSNLRVQFRDGFMVCLPFLPKLLIKCAIFLLSLQILVVFFHFGDAAMFFHHFLEVAPALCGGSGGEVLCEGFKYLAGSL